MTRASETEFADPHPQRALTLRNLVGVGDIIWMNVKQADASNRMTLEKASPSLPSMNDLTWPRHD